MAKDFDKIRAQLEGQLESLEEQLAEMSETLRLPEDDDIEEQAIEVNVDEVLSRLSRARRDETMLIRAALQRIEDGTYGKCVMCGNQIEARRLEALPEAERCLSCAKKVGGG